jgi:hypothetical protein
MPRRSSFVPPASTSSSPRSCSGTPPASPAPSPFPINQRLDAGVFHRQRTIAFLRRRCGAVPARHLGDKIEAYAMLHSAEVLADGWASGSAPVASHECGPARPYFGPVNAIFRDALPAPCPGAFCRVFSVKPWSKPPCQRILKASDWRYNPMKQFVFLEKCRAPRKIPPCKGIRDARPLPQLAGA